MVQFTNILYHLKNSNAEIIFCIRKSFCQREELEVCFLWLYILISTLLIFASCRFVLSSIELRCSILDVMWLRHDSMPSKAIDSLNSLLIGFIPSFHILIGPRQGHWPDNLLNKTGTDLSIFMLSDWTPWVRPLETGDDVGEFGELLPEPRSVHQDDRILRRD